MYGRMMEDKFSKPNQILLSKLLIQEMMNISHIMICIVYQYEDWEQIRSNSMA